MDAYSPVAFGSLGLARKRLQPHRICGHVRHKKKAQSAKTARILNKDASETADARFGKNNAWSKVHTDTGNRNQNRRESG